MSSKFYVTTAGLTGIIALFLLQASEIIELPEVITVNPLYIVLAGLGALGAVAAFKFL